MCERCRLSLCGTVPIDGVTTMLLDARTRDQLPLQLPHFTDHYAAKFDAYAANGTISRRRGVIRPRISHFWSLAPHPLHG